MTLKYTVESLEGIDEAAQAFYQEQEGGGYVLQVEGAVPKNQFEEVNQKAVDNATEAQRRRKTLERVTGKLGLENADGLDDALENLLSKAQNPPKKDDKDQQAIIDQINSKAEEQVKAAQEKLTGYAKRSAEAEVKAAIAQAGFHPEAVDMVALQAMGRVQIDTDKGEWYIQKQDGSGPLAGSGPSGSATVNDLASELAAAMPSFLKDDGKGGGGKPPASGSNDGAKSVTRSQFDAMSQAERADFSKSGGKVTDG